MGKFWAQEPADTPRVAAGVKSRVDRLRCLGNAVVPQIPELIGRAILSAIVIEARSGETGTGSTEGKSAGRDGIAQGAAA